MHPSENNSPELSLPKPVQESPETASSGYQEKSKSNSPIEDSVSKESILKDLNNKVAGITSSISSNNNQSSSNNDSAISNPNNGASLANDNPLAANDDDLIEKEWVEKAKSIVNKTKEDPREQSKELSYMKSDYMKKRYNKDVKVGE